MFVHILLDFQWVSVQGLLVRLVFVMVFNFAVGGRDIDKLLLFVRWRLLSSAMVIGLSFVSQMLWTGPVSSTTSSAYSSEAINLTLIHKHS